MPTARPCMGCGQAVRVPLNVCLECGGAVLYADLSGQDFAVEAGPIASQNFRNQAVGYLGSSLEGFDSVKGDKLLASERVRVVEGLAQPTAEGLVQALGPKETAARVVRGATPTVGAGGMLKNGLPFLGVGLGAALGLAWNPIGWAIGGAVAVGLAVFNMRQKVKVLGVAPVGPLLEEHVSDTARRLAAVKQQLDEPSRRELEVIGQRGFDVIVKLTDPDDLVALSTGGGQSEMGETAVKLVAEAVGIAERAVKAGRQSFTEEELKTLRRIGQSTELALGGLSGAGDGAIEALENKMREEVELVRETIEELEHMV